MRNVLSLWLLLAAVPALAAGDVADCMAKCSSRAQPCLQGCKDDKCMIRCSNQIQSCAATCDGKGIDPKLAEKAAREQREQSAASQRTKAPGSKR